MYTAVGMYIEKICLYYNNSVMQFADETSKTLKDTLEILTDLIADKQTDSEIWHRAVTDLIRIMCSLPLGEMRTALNRIWRDSHISEAIRVEKSVDLLVSAAADEAEIRNIDDECATVELIRALQATDLADDNQEYLGIFGRVQTPDNGV